MNCHLINQVKDGDVDEDTGELKLFYIIDVRIIVSRT
jgi:hypothetical protein